MSTRCYEDIAFTVPAGRPDRQRHVHGRDQLGQPGHRLRHHRLRDDNGDGQPRRDAVVGTSAQGSTDQRVDQLRRAGEIIAGKRFIVRVVNFAGGVENYSGQITYQGPPPSGPATKES